MKKKKYVRYQEGADMYSMSVRKFQDLAKDAGKSSNMSTIQ